jgi:CubicO group peptidase (beta-lactamase class C family)
MGFTAMYPYVSGLPHSAYGHTGQGGSAGFADPEQGLGFGYVPNQTQYVDDVRFARLAEAVYRCLARRGRALS